MIIAMIILIGIGLLIGLYLDHLPEALHSNENFLEWAANHYNSTNRGVVGDISLFEKRCAIGYFNPQWINKIKDGNSYNTMFTKHKYFTKIVKLAYILESNKFRYINKGLKLAVMRLHDNAGNWDRDGLSKMGIKNYNGIIVKYDLKLLIKQ